MTGNKAGYSERKLLLVLSAVFLLALIPVFLIAQYAYPAADDFTYGIAAAHAWNDTHSLSAVLSAAWNGTLET